MPYLAFELYTLTSKPVYPQGACMGKKNKLTIHCYVSVEKVAI